METTLTKLQQAIIQALPAVDRRFFVTGGGVLAGYVLGHRTTDDLDLFTADPAAMVDADRLVRALADAVRAEIEVVHTAPDFRRYLLTAQDDSVRLDVVLDRAPQLYPKVDRGGVITDSTEEIFVNKICALVGRSEARDLIDLMFLERTGLRVEHFLDAACRKDAGVSPATIAWLLSSFRAPRSLPDTVRSAELEAYAKALEARMRRAALP
jgi:Nucleotidyl transferase AbiEii toxin, Type IV TA system